MMNVYKSIRNSIADALNIFVGNLNLWLEQNKAKKLEATQRY